MPDINPILSSSAQYKQAFEEGLTRILQHKTAGTFILACANLFQHPWLLDKELQKDLKNNNKALLLDAYNYIKEHYQTCYRDGRQPDDAPDDITVMNSLFEIGLENLEEVEYRKVNSDGVDYLLYYNQLRSFRPARMSKTENIQLDTPFNPEGFHFAKSFLQKEIFAEGEYNGKQLSLLYNKFPFIHYHALLIVNKARHNNQYLTRDILDYIANLQTHTQQQCPEFVVAYNSLGAGASVNHLHFQTYLEATPLAIFSAYFTHNGGDLSYPATCQAFTNSFDAWQTIKSLHKRNTPYNLLFKDNKIYCLPRIVSSRKKAGKSLSGIDTSLYGWADMAGLINIDNKKLLTELSAAQIVLSLESVSALIN